MSVAQRLPSSVIVVASRRKTPRVSATDQMDVQIVTVLVPAEVVDLSFGGFSIETRCSLRIGAVHKFRFTTAAGRTVELLARVIHCRRKTTEDWSERYITGCEFLVDRAGSDALVDELMESATDVLSVE